MKKFNLKNFVRSCLLVTSVLLNNTIASESSEQDFDSYVVYVEDINKCIDKIESLAEPGTLFVFDMDETLVTRHDGFYPKYLKNYFTAEKGANVLDDKLYFNLTTTILKAQKSWNQVFDNIRNKGGKIILLSSSAGIENDTPPELYIETLKFKENVVNLFNLTFDHLSNGYGLIQTKDGKLKIAASGYGAINASGGTDKAIVLHHLLPIFKYTPKKIVFIDNNPMYMGNMLKKFPKNLVAINFMGIDAMKEYQNNDDHVYLVNLFYLPTKDIGKYSIRLYNQQGPDYMSVQAKIEKLDPLTILESSQQNKRSNSTNNLSSNKRTKIGQ